jgi:hypothetical protein
VATAAVAAVSTRREEVGGEDAEPTHRVGVDRLAPPERFVVALQDLDTPGVLLGEPAGVRCVPPAVAKCR